MSDIRTVMMLVLCLIFGVIIFGSLDYSLCPESMTEFNITIENSSESTYAMKGKDFMDHALTMKCSGLPSWVVWIFYIPISVGLIYAVIPFK